MISKEEIQRWPVLGRIKDITIFPKINVKKAKKAIKCYGNAEIYPNAVILLIDNTILRSAKQGMFIAGNKLYAYSAFSGKFSIPLIEIKTLHPEIKNRFKIPLFGFTINDYYFVSLPGLNEVISEDDIQKTGLEILLLVLSSIITCDII
jgi:hypothetical protein